MVTTSSSCSIDAPLSDVWAVLADFGRLAEWAVSVDHSECLTVPPVVVGSIRRVQVGRRVLLETITTWEPEATLAYSIEGLPPVVGAVSNTWTLAAEETGTTLILTASVAPAPSLALKPAAFALARLFKSANDGLLSGLERRMRVESP